MFTSRSLVLVVKLLSSALLIKNVIKNCDHGTLRELFPFVK